MRPLTDSVHHSKRHGFDAMAAKERRRLVMHIVPADWAAEWLRPVSPNMKLVGPVLAGPGKPLPAQFQVGSHLC